MFKAILAVSKSYSETQVLPFLRSLEGKFYGHLVLFSDRTFSYQSKSYKIVIIDITTDTFIKSNPKQFNTVNNERFLWFHKFLNENPTIEEVFLCDIRDVIFQEDPFVIIKDNKVQIAIESKIIRECPFNKGWMLSLYGKEYVESIEHEYISCCGTVLGKRDCMLEYFEFMIQSMLKIGKQLDSGDQHFIVDQGIHNFFCINFPEKFTKHTNMNGGICTMGWAPSSRISNNNSFFLNDVGDVFPIVHQYDRFGWAKTMVHQLYCQDLNVVPTTKNKLKATLKKGLQFFHK